VAGTQYESKIGNQEDPDDRSYERLANQLFALDEDIIGCYIIRITDGVVAADLVRDEYKTTIKPFGHTGGGMAAKWGLAGLSASKRMDGERGKTLYIVAARESFVTLLFLHPTNENMEIGVMLSPNADPKKMYYFLIDQLSNNES
jgi:hypothetical protein